MTQKKRITVRKQAHEWGARRDEELPRSTYLGGEFEVDGSVGREVVEIDGNAAQAGTRRTRTSADARLAPKSHVRTRASVD